MAVLYVLAMVAVIVGLDVALFRHHGTRQSSCFQHEAHEGREVGIANAFASLVLFVFESGGC